MLLDVSKPEPSKPKLEYKDYEIWLGWYHLGQGSHPPTKPERVGVVRATSFKIACYLYELQSQIDSLQRRMERSDNYIEDIHFGTLYYNGKTNSNSWTGKYYETEKEALASFAYIKTKA